MEGVFDRVSYRKFFGYIGEARLHGKAPGTTSPAYHLFAHEMMIDKNLTCTGVCFTLYEDEPQYCDSDESNEGLVLKFVSAGKIVLRIIENKLHILELRGGGGFRIGSFLIQLAIEFAIRDEYEEISLGSTRGSGEFYFKLGFVPPQENLQREDIIERLKKNQYSKQQLCIDGGHMFLPRESLIIWKQKILKTPILPGVFGMGVSPNIPDINYSNSKCHHDLFFSSRSDEKPKLSEVKNEQEKIVCKSN